ncbi:hypothetical protein MIND_00012500 [Mycena indigotica]|uniref:Uncharacterized protein n=1 Tax=Mycena indigotica TaxID=2126181 RepID=A0A8H6WDS5_9AGAR|nr:uncharacterized protein MIND_00012500 [Mycena indigotica]KAF7314984.1 hypothetical protein MIND_00012500 [Mycena indigotica]
MSTWDASLKALKDKVPDAAEPGAAATLDARIAIAEKEFDATLVWLVLCADGTKIHIKTNGVQHDGEGLCPRIGTGAFKGFQTSQFFGPYNLLITATTVTLSNPWGIVYKGIGYAQPAIRGSWSVVF